MMRHTVLVLAMPPGRDIGHAAPLRDVQDYRVGIISLVCHHMTPFRQGLDNIDAMLTSAYCPGVILMTRAALRIGGHMDLGRQSST